MDLTQYELLQQKMAKLIEATEIGTQLHGIDALKERKLIDGMIETQAET